MIDIQKLIKYHDFPEAGTLSKIRLNVVEESVEKNKGKQRGCCVCVKHVCNNCERTIMCWVEEADRRERKQMQKELAFNAENVVCVKTVSPEQNATNKQNECVSPHVTEEATAPPPAYNTNHYPVAEISALRLDLDLDRSRTPQRTAQELEQDRQRMAQQMAAKAERLAEARAQIELTLAAQRAAQAEADARAARVGAEAAERLAQRLTAQFQAQLHGRLSAALRHATHAEEDRKEKKKPLTMVVMQQRQPKQPSKPASSRSNPAGRKRQKGRAAGGKWSCYVCSTNAHSYRVCKKCSLCKREGHWSRECPNTKSN